MDTINGRLKILRKHFRLNQSEIADKLSITQSYYSALESGKKKIGTEIILSLIALFEVSEPWLLSGRGNIFIGEVQQERVVEKSPSTRVVGQNKIAATTHDGDSGIVQVDESSILPLIQSEGEKLQFIYEKLLDMRILQKELLNVPFDSRHPEPFFKFIGEEISRFSELKYDDIQNMSLKEKQAYLDRICHISHTSYRKFFYLFSGLFVGVLSSKNEGQ